MYYINLLDDLYCVYNFEDSFLIAQFNTFEDARAYVESLNGIVVLNENDKTKFDKDKLMNNEKKQNTKSDKGKFVADERNKKNKKRK